VKVPTGAKGGMILLSTDVNAIVGTGIWSQLAARLSTWRQRFFRPSIVDRIVLEEIDRFGVPLGWSISEMFRGRYYDPEERVLYLERSFFVEILDAPYPMLRAIAEKLRRAFEQQEVILKSYETDEAEHIRNRGVPLL
jgi:hypothetical protein